MHARGTNPAAVSVSCETEHMSGLDERVQWAIIDTLREAGAVFAFIHGSTARGTARTDSDIDVAAWWASDPPPSFDVASCGFFGRSQTISPSCDLRYVEVDDRIVLAMLNDPSDLDQFSRQVAEWLGA